MEWSVVILGIVAQSTFILVDRKGRYTLAGVLKGLASLLFCILGWVEMQNAHNPEFASCIEIGLILGMLGDIGMHLRLIFPKSKTITMGIGTAFFLLGHVLYMLALLPIETGALIYALTAGVILCAALAMCIIRKVTVKGVLKTLGTCYFLIICIMVSVAVTLHIMEPKSTPRLLFAVGATLFIVSDIIMTLNLFLPNPKKWYRPVNLFVYYIGQLLIAMTVHSM